MKITSFGMSFGACLALATAIALPASATYGWQSPVNTYWDWNYTTHQVGDRNVHTGNIVDYASYVQPWNTAVSQFVYMNGTGYCYVYAYCVDGTTMQSNRGQFMKSNYCQTGACWDDSYQSGGYVAAP